MKKIILLFCFFVFLLLLVDSVSGALEDFTTYIEVDEDNDITVDTNTITIDTLRRDAESHVTYDMGVDHFGDFMHYVDVKITSCGLRGLGHYWAISDGSNTHSEMRSGNDAIGSYVSRISTGVYRFYLIAYDNGDDAESWDCSVNTQYYCTITRIDTSVTCKIYDSATRLVGDLLHTLSVTSTTTTRRYIIACASAELGTYTDISISYIVSNLDLNEGVDNEPSFGSLYYPVNNSVDLCPCCVVLGVNVSDVEGDVIGISFLSNYSGSWIEILSFVDVINGSYYGVVNNFTYFNWTYYWRVNLSGSGGNNASEIFTFDTTNNITCGGIGISGAVDEELIQEYFILALLFSLIALVFAIRKKKGN